MRMLSVVLFVLGSLVPALAQQWIEYKDEAAGYRIEFPGKPKVETQLVKTTAGDRHMGVATLNVERNGAWLELMTVIPGRPAIYNPDPQVTLDRTRDNAVRAVNGKLREEKRLTVNGEPARRTVIDMPDGRVVVMLQIMRGDQLYQTIAVVSAGAENSADTERFIGSFSLVPRQ
jgi:hypothetical protein